MHWAGKATIVFVLGAGVGSCVASTSPPPEDEVTIKTKYVDRPVEKTVIVNQVGIPRECSEALDLAGRVKVDATALVGGNTKVLDMLADGHQALTVGDGTEVNNQRDKLYKLEVSLNATSQDLTLIHIPKLDTALSACEATKAYKEKK